SVVTGPTPAKMNSSCTDPRELRTTATRAWWSRHPEQAAAFLLGIATALFIEWDLEHGVMTTRHSSPAKRLATTAPPAAPPRPPPPRPPRPAPRPPRRCGLATCRPGMPAPRLATRCVAAKPAPAARRNASPGPGYGCLAPADGRGGGAGLGAGPRLAGGRQ